MKTNTERALENIADELKNINKNLKIINKSLESPVDNLPERDAFVNSEIADLFTDMMDKNAKTDEILRIVNFSMEVMNLKHKYDVDDIYSKYSSNEEKFRDPLGHVIKVPTVDLFNAEENFKGWQYPDKAEYESCKEGIKGLFDDISKEDEFHTDEKANEKVGIDSDPNEQIKKKKLEHLAFAADDLCKQLFKEDK